MTLSATEYTRLRDLTGGRTVTSDDDHLTDTELQAEYDAAGGWELGVVYVLRRRYRMLAGFFNVSRELNSETRVQKREALGKMLEDAERALGLSGSPLYTGTLDTGLDSESTDTDS